MEVRLNLADFVESKFLPNAEIDDTTAANLANQLLSQLDAKIAATPNDADKFLHKKNLQELSDTLKVSTNFVKATVLLKKLLKICMLLHSTVHLIIEIFLQIDSCVNSLVKLLDARSKIKARVSR